ncbi:DUF3662 and FHA domain-containing protein [Corynebacterium sp. H113]|uniref:DUF3662 and FHA domain-containing protein n=1 Tax=Corynebacterium sp. H113 TaxID=3133419 RepID=UPI0030B4B5B9
MDFLGRIRKLDSSLQRGLDNSFARVFGGKVVPNELEECLKQEIEDFLMQDAQGRFLAPNEFRIGISPKDFANLTATEPQLPEHLANRMSRYCRNNGWVLAGPVAVVLQKLDSLHTGQLKTASQFLEESGTQSAYLGEDGQVLTDLPDESSQANRSPDANNTSESADSGAGVAGADVAAGAAGAGAAAGVAGAAASAPTSSAFRPHDEANNVDAGDYNNPANYKSNNPAAQSQGWGTSPGQDSVAKPTTGAPAAPAAPAASGVSADDNVADADFAQQNENAHVETFSTASRPVQVPPGPQEPEQNTPTVTLYLQDGSNRKFEVRPGSNIIGRGTASDFRLPDTGVSRQHAEITWDGRDAILVDLHSTNGTIVNDGPIDNWLLADGDIVSMGHSVMEVRIR